MSCPPFPAVSAQISTRAAAETRLANLYHRLKDRDLNSIVVSRPVNISYLTGYLSRDSFLVVSPKRNVYVTDSRYT